MVVGASRGAGKEMGEKKAQLSRFMSNLDRGFLGLGQHNRLILSGKGFYDPIFGLGVTVYLDGEMGA